jgi:iron-sulfur cluster assembly accessory protein
MNPNIIFTEAACGYIKKLIEKNKGVGFRLSIKKTGCSGYSYLPTIVDKVNPTDVTFDIAAGLTIYVDSVWLELLQGLQIDYIEDEKTGLKQKRLVFTNPNESSRCGCGESFHIE